MEAGHVGSRVHTARVVSGECRSGNRSPPHTGLRSMPWRRTGGVYPRSATFSRDHLCMSLWTPAARPRTSPWPPRTPPAPWHSRASRSVPRITRDSRTSAWPPPDAPPAPRPRAPWSPPNLGAGGWGFGITAMQGGRRPVSRQPRTCPWPGGRLSGGTCGMTVDGLGIVGSILRTFPRPSTAFPQVPPVLLHYSLRETNYVTG